MVTHAVPSPFSSPRTALFGKECALSLPGSHTKSLMLGTRTNPAGALETGWSVTLTLGSSLPAQSPLQMKGFMPRW